MGGFQPLEHVLMVHCKGICLDLSVEQCDSDSEHDSDCDSDGDSDC